MPMGMFGSPDINMDGRYEPLLDCMWTISLPVNKQVNGTLSPFGREGSATTNCRYDSVRVNTGAPA